MTNAYHGIIFDIDGVLEFHGRAYPGAAETLEWLRQRGVAIRLLSNSTLKSRQSAAERLQQKGLKVYAEEVITASYATAEYLREIRPGSSWIMLDGAGLKEFAEFPQNEADPEIIVVGDNRSCFDFDTLNKALRLLKKGARLIGMTAELIDYSMGDWELNVGSWVQMLERASGVQATYIGKPAPYGFELALRSMGLPRDRVLMVGDQLGTDIKGANAVGMRSALVRTGEYELRPRTEQAQPDYVIDSVTDLKKILG
ncbi:MAG: HAD-IIA family hydrolase [Anaerolineales bacterium]|nr:HAD-IIA family hydrolase [Anaerolineales bacterium]